MPYYHIVFSHNEILSCTETDHTAVPDMNVRYEQQNGRLIYAIIKAETAEEAIVKAKQLVESSGSGENK